MARLLIIEDNPDLAEGLRVNLQIEGHEVDICAHGHEAVDAVADLQPDLIVLDVMLPGQDGFAILQELRERGVSSAVLMLTARGEETDKVRALRLGADDYVTKPFGLMELIARVEALLRRTARPAPATGGRIALFADVEVDRNTRQVWRAGELVGLTPREMDLLLTMANRPNRVLSRHDLLKTVWGHSSEVASRTVDTHMAELRRKLEQDPASPAHLKTARGAGYFLDTGIEG